MLALRDRESHGRRAARRGDDDRGGAERGRRAGRGVRRERDRARPRNGNRGPVAAPQNVYACAGRRGVARDRGRAPTTQWRALRERPRRSRSGRAIPHSPPPRAAGPRTTRSTSDLAAWCADQDARRAGRRCSARRASPRAYVVDARDIAHNPQLLHRGFFEVEDHPVTGASPDPGGAVPVRRHRADARGSAAPRRPSGSTTTRSSAAMLGLTDDELARARAPAASSATTSEWAT